MADGNKGTCFKSQTEVSPWIIVNLLNIYKVYKIEVSQMHTGDDYFVNWNLYLTYENPRMTWKSIPKTLCSAFSYLVTSSNFKLIHCTKAGVIGQYVLIETSNTRYTICEIETWGDFVRESS